MWIVLDYRGLEGDDVGVMRVIDDLVFLGVVGVLLGGESVHFIRIAFVGDIGVGSEVVLRSLVLQFVWVWCEFAGHWDILDVLGRSHIGLVVLGNRALDHIGFLVELAVEVVSPVIFIKHVGGLIHSDLSLGPEVVCLRLVLSVRLILVQIRLRSREEVLLIVPGIVLWRRINWHVSTTLLITPAIIGGERDNGNP